MAIKKSEIYSRIWAACDKLRGGVEPARYKDYILTLLFVKYVSDRYKSNDTWDIEVPKGGSFDDIVKLKGTKNIGEGVNIVIGELARVNDLKGIIDIADFNSEELGTGKEAVDKLSGLIEVFQKPELDFSYNRAGGDDILGDAYEYLMKNFAVESGKSKGQFYTPGEVSRIMAQVIGINEATGSDKTIYDPACGSGSLLIRAADAAPKKSDGTPNVAIFGQEKEKATAGLARMNLVLHNKATGVIEGNKSTLANPQFKDERNPNLLKTFDYIVMNPPFSDKSWMDGMNITVKGDVATEMYGRFDGYKVPPEKNGDYAWFLHVLKSLKSTGKAAIILPHGVLFRGNSEADIRKEIIDRGYIKGIIGLPANLFFGTGIPACIIVIDKEDAADRKGIFMIDASKGFVKDGSKNRLREQDIYKIVTTFNMMDISNPKYARFILNDEIKITNEYNLNIPRYIDSSEPEDLQDINAHLNGGIPTADIDNMKEYWEVYPSLKDILFKSLRDGYYTPSVEKNAIIDTISSHNEFIQHANIVDSAYTSWKEDCTPSLMDLTQGDDPKAIIRELSEALFLRFENVPLIDKYDVYQKLMEYWAETMQDDVYAVCFDGYSVGRKVAYEYVTKKKKVNGVTVEEKTDKVKSYDGELIPKALLMEHYFPEELTALQKYQSELDYITAQLQELEEENSGDDGYLSLLEDTKEVTIRARIKVIRKDAESAEELTVLAEYLRLAAIASDAKRLIREAGNMLDMAAREQYEKMSDEDIKRLLVEEKWFSAIYNGIDAIYSAVSHKLSSRIIELVERYEFTLAECEVGVDKLERKVKSHLERMGFVW